MQLSVQIKAQTFHITSSYIMRHDNNWKPLCTDNEQQLNAYCTDYQSILIICHLEKLGIDITRAFTFCIKVELVITAISTCNCSTHEHKLY